MPEPQDVHIDSALTTFSRKYENQSFIWKQVMPIVPVKKRSDKFFRYVVEDYFRIPDDAVSPKAYPNEVGLRVDTDNYSVQDYALEDWVSKEEEDNADSPLAPRTDATEFLVELLNLAQEKRVADIVFNPATYPSTNVVTLSGTSQWGGSADDPIGDIMRGLDTAFQRPNLIVFGAEAWSKFRQLPEVIDAVKATPGASLKGALASADEVAKLFEVEKVLIGLAKYNVSAEGQAASYSRLWGKHVALLYVKKKPTIRSVTFGATFVEMDMTVMTGWDGRRGAKGATWIKVAWNNDTKVIAPDVGYLIQNAVA